MPITAHLLGERRRGGTGPAQLAQRCDDLEGGIARAHRTLPLYQPIAKVGKDADGPEG